LAPGGSIGMVRLNPNHLEASMSRVVLLAATTLALLPRVAAAQSADASGTPATVQVSLWESVQIVDQRRSVHGFRLVLPYGRNRDLHGADIGIVGRLDGELEGAQVGVAGVVDGNVTGLQYNWLLSTAGGRVQGLQWSGVNMAGSFEGAQLGLLNYVESPSIGGRVGFANIALAEMHGADLGVVNYAARVEGVQIGFVNVTEHLHGVQIGIVNVAPNGFLPVFVLFNAAL
jgi:hypothetical protein